MVLVGQPIESTASTPEGRLWVAHALPPSWVATMDGELNPVPARIESRPDPPEAAQQSDELGQLMVDNGGVPLGRDSACQLAPPSVEPNTCPAVSFGSDPTAQQSEAPAQATPVRSPVPLLSPLVWSVQVPPPSVVTSTRLAPEPALPTATQLEVEAHEMPSNSPEDSGRLSAAQLTPSAVSITTGAMASLDAKTVTPIPSAKQLVSEVHDTESKSPVPLGAVSTFQVEPPSLVAATEAATGEEPLVTKVKPTTQQCDGSGHEMAMGMPTSVGRSSTDHVFQPSVVARTAGAPLASAGNREARGGRGAGDGRQSAQTGRRHRLGDPAASAVSGGDDRGRTQDVRQRYLVRRRRLGPHQVLQHRAGNETLTTARPLRPRSRTNQASVVMQ